MFHLFFFCFSFLRSYIYEIKITKNRKCMILNQSNKGNDQKKILKFSFSTNHIFSQTRRVGEIDIIRDRHIAPLILISSSISNFFNIYFFTVYLFFFNNSVDSLFIINLIICYRSVIIKMIFCVSTDKYSALFLFIITLVQFLLSIFSFRRWFLFLK